MSRSLRSAGIVALFASAALVLTACAAIEVPGVDPAGVWGDSAAGSAKPYLQLSGDGQVSGSDGCNRLISSWSGAGSTITFGPVASTRRACEGVDTWLSNAATAKVDGSSLSVYDSQSKQIGELMRTNDVPSSAEPSPAPTAGPTPTLPTPGELTPPLVGAWGTAEKTTPHLVFAADQTVSGSDGCNVIAGSWSLKGGVVTFSRLVSTLMACENVDTWLSGAATATVSGSTMAVYDSSAKELGTLARTP